MIAQAEVVHCYIPCCDQCGGDVDCYSDPPGPTYCERCCPDHDYKHDKWERARICQTCGKRREYEPMDDDVI